MTTIHKTMRLGMRLGMSATALTLMAMPASAEMTDSAQQFLSENGIAPALIEQASAAAAADFKIPQDWIDKAAAEGPIDFSTNDTAQHVAAWLPVFQARYPDIDIIATETSGAARAVQPLLAYKSHWWIMPKRTRWKNWMIFLHGLAFQKIVVLRMALMPVCRIRHGALPIIRIVSARMNCRQPGGILYQKTRRSKMAGLVLPTVPNCGRLIFGPIKITAPSV